MEAFKFRLEASKPMVDVSGGVVRFAKESDFPKLEGLAIASIFLKPGGIRIPHWHPNANEMDYVISGKAGIALFGPADEANPEGVVSHFELGPGDISFLPQGWFHSIKNAGQEDLHILVIFNNASPQDIGLPHALGGMQISVLAKVLEISEDEVKRLNTEPKFLFPDQPV